MTPAEIEKEAERIFDEFDSMYGDRTFKMILKSLRAIRNAALEEAAKVSESKHVHFMHCNCENIAASIRALKIGDEK